MQYNYRFIYLYNYIGDEMLIKYNTKELLLEKIREDGKIRIGLEKDFLLLNLYWYTRYFFVYTFF